MERMAVMRRLSVRVMHVPGAGFIRPVVMGLRLARHHRVLERIAADDRSRIHPLERECERDHPQQEQSSELEH